MQHHPDVLIVGGGVIGLTSAYFLARDGVRVQILDRSAPGAEASWAGAGIIPPGNPEGARTAYDRLRARSARAFPELSAELRERTGMDNGYRLCGGIEVFEGDHEPVTGLWSQEGIEFRPLLPESLRELEPMVRLSEATAFYLPGMAQVRNPWHLRALITACEKAGVDIVADAPVVRFNTAGNRITAAVAESGHEYFAERFLVASGAWCDRLLAPLGVRTGVHPVRGQMVLYQPPRPLISRIIACTKRYLVPRDDGRILVGSTEEPEAGFEKRTTESGTAGLVRFATGLVGELASAPIEKSWAGLRPGSPDGLPFLGQVPGWRNAFLASGHFRAGIQTSIGSAEIMSALLREQPPPIDIADFRIDRPPAPPPPTAFRS
jgi:glycine oxidase